MLKRRAAYAWSVAKARTAARLMRLARRMRMQSRVQHFAARVRKHALVAAHERRCMEGG